MPLRQWGPPGTGPGHFRPTGGDHPYCENIEKDVWARVCDEDAHRVEVFDKKGVFKREIPIKLEALG